MILRKQGKGNDPLNLLNNLLCIFYPYYFFFFLTKAYSVFLGSVGDWIHLQLSEKASSRVKTMVLFWGTNFVVVEQLLRSLEQTTKVSLSGLGRC